MSKVPERELVSNEWLVKSFQRLNMMFFDNEIPGSLRLSFMKNCGYWQGTGKQRRYRHVEAYFDHQKDAIFVADELRLFPNLAMIDLIHEMAHAHLHFNGYKGYDSDAGHGSQFQIEIGRLIRAGAYDGLL